MLSRASLRLAPELHVEDGARHEDGGEQVRDQSDDQRDGEAAHRAGAEDEQERAGDDGGDVRVDDGDQRAVEARPRWPPPTALPARISSLMRSKMSTLESTAMPMESTRPAMPGSVQVASM